MTDLIKRLEEAETGDRQCDSLIDRILNLRPPWAAQDKTPLTAWEDGRVTMGPNGAGWDAPRYTTSLDAALALAERVLPGWTWDVARQSNGLHRAGLYKPKSSFMVAVPDKQTLALALCIAILKATDTGRE